MSTQVAFIGCGSMARHHLRQILTHFDNTSVPVVCEPSPKEYAATAELFTSLNRPAPRNEPDLEKLLVECGNQLDAAFIITPHALHRDQAQACLEAGLDVLLEKPMVMNAAEANSLITTRDRTGKNLVVAFQGSLSPQVRTAVSMLRSGILGSILNINGLVWQSWNAGTQNTWRQEPKLAGGGFMFDTGAHMLNTVADLAGEPFVEVAAWLDNRNRPVDILGVVIGRLASGTLVTFNACGDTIPSCASDIRVICTKAMLRTGIWGEFLEIQYHEKDGWQKLPVPPSLGVWEQFQSVRTGKIENPSPPEVGLRMALLWDAIRESAQQNGQPVSVSKIN
jgi:predicted dehydrogenase